MSREHAGPPFQLDPTPSSRSSVRLGVSNDRSLSPDNPFVFRDHTGEEHRIWINAGFPGESMGFKGNLSDLARSYALKPLWDILDWDPHPGRFGFTEGAETVLLDIDLDAFVMDLEDFTFAWREEVWEVRFRKESNYGASAGWSGKRFVGELIKRNGHVNDRPGTFLLWGRMRNAVRIQGSESLRPRRCDSRNLIG